MTRSETKNVPLLCSFSILTNAIKTTAPKMPTRKSRVLSDSENDFQSQDDLTVVSKTRRDTWD